MGDKDPTMEKYLIYQLKDGTVKRRLINDLEKAQQIVDLNKPVKLDGVSVHIVGIGTEEDYQHHREFLGRPSYEKLKADIEHFKKYKEWPK